MKIAERTFEDGNRLIVQETHDFNPVLDRAASLRSAGAEDLGESKLIGLVPMKLWAEWGKKWGVNPNDAAAMREVVARELASSDNAQFRVWEGRF